MGSVHVVTLCDMRCGNTTVAIAVLSLLIWVRDWHFNFQIKQLYILLAKQLKTSLRCVTIWKWKFELYSMDFASRLSGQCWIIWWHLGFLAGQVCRVAEAVVDCQGHHGNPSHKDIIGVCFLTSWTNNWGSPNSAECWRSGQSLVCSRTTEAPVNCDSDWEFWVKLNIPWSCDDKNWLIDYCWDGAIGCEDGDGLGSLLWGWWGDGDKCCGDGVRICDGARCGQTPVSVTFYIVSSVTYFTVLACWIDQGVIGKYGQSVDK